MKSLLKQGTTSGSAPLEVINMKIVDNQNMQDQVIKGVYDNPDVALCRELICNMSDSHLAAGNPERPPVVTLASKMEPYLTFRDFGKGMTHEEIKKVYSQIGMSDKRESGVQTGEKGLGAKSPLAYRDSFSLTCYDEDGYRAYSVCYSDERRAQVLLLAQGPNDGSTDPETGIEYPCEERGVEIVIAVKDGDVTAMNSNVMDTISNFAHPFSNGVAKPVVSGFKAAPTGHDSEAHEARVLGTAEHPSSARHGNDTVALTSLTDSWAKAHMVTEYVGYVGEFQTGANHNYYRRQHSTGAAAFYNANVKYEVAELGKLLKDEEERKEFRKKFSLAMKQNNLVFFVPLLSEEDQLPLVSTTAGRDTIQPHPRTTAWLRTVLADFESKLVQHLVARLLLTGNYFEAFQMIQEEQWFFDQDFAGRMTALLETSATERVWPKFNCQRFIYHGNDGYQPITDLKEQLANSLTAVMGTGGVNPDRGSIIRKALRWHTVGKSKAFTRNNTQKHFCDKLRNNKKLLIVDDHRQWKARVEASRVWVGRDTALIVEAKKDDWMATHGAHPEYCADKDDHVRFKKAIKDALELFGLAPVFVSELPKYSVVRTPSAAGSAASKAARSAPSTPALRVYSSTAWKESDRFSELLNWDKAAQHVKDGKFIYVKLKGNNMNIEGHVNHYSGIGSLMSASKTWKQIMRSSLGVADDETGEGNGTQVIYGIRETEMPKAGMPDNAIEFTDWFAKEVVFMKPLMERYYLACALTEMLSDCDVTLKPVKKDRSGKAHCYRLKNDIAFVSPPHLREVLQLLQDRQDITAAMRYASHLSELCDLSAFVESRPAIAQLYKELDDRFSATKHSKVEGNFYGEYKDAVKALFDAIPALPVLAKMEDACRHVHTNRVKRVTNYESESNYPKRLKEMFQWRPWVEPSHCESRDRTTYWKSNQYKLVQSIVDCCANNTTALTKADFPKLPRTKSRTGLKY